MLKSLFYRQFYILAGLGITFFLLAANVTSSVTAASAEYESYCQVSMQGVDSAALFDRFGALLGSYPSTHSMTELPGSGTGSSQADTVFTMPFGSGANRLIIQQNQPSAISLRVTYYEHTPDRGDTPRYMVVFADIALNSGGSAMVDINCTTEMGKMKMILDQNGDTISDETRYPNGILTEKQIQDKIAPVTVIKTVANPFGLFLTDVVEIQLEPRDTGSGILKTEYSLDGGATWKVYRQPFKVTPQKTPLIFARSVDVAGNTESPVAYQNLAPSNRIPTLIWILIGADGLFMVTAFLSFSYLKAALKEQKAAK